MNDSLDPLPPPIYHPKVSDEDHPPVSGSVKFRKWCFNAGLVYKKHKDNAPTTFHKILSKDIESLIKPQEITHLLLNGGCLSVPSDREESFLTEYIKTVIEDNPNNRLYICEQKTTPLFVMMSEFDLKLPNLPSHEQLMAIISSIQKGMLKTLSICKGYDTDGFPKPNMLVYVVDAKKSKFTNKSTETKNGEASNKKENDVCYQSGIHCVWPMLHVKTETAWILRASILEQLLQDTKDGKIVDPLEGWVETYDYRVFESNGLRMMGSRKAEVCPICNGKPLESFRFSDKKSKITAYMTSSFSAEEAGGNSVNICQKCQGMGKLDCARPYSYFGAFDGNGELEKELHLKFKQDSIALIKASTIRVSDHNRNLVGELDLSNVLPSKEFERLRYSVENYRKEQLYQTKKQKSVKDGPLDSSVIKGSEKDGRSLLFTSTFDDSGNFDSRRFSAKVELTTIECNTKLYNLVADYLRESCKHGGPEPELRSLKYGVSQSNKCLYYATTNCKWCPNKNDEHAHSTNYFIFTTDGCIRKCFSPKRPVGAPLACKVWKEKCQKLPMRLHTLLFNADFRNFEEEKRENDSSSPLLWQLFGVPSGVTKNEENSLSQNTSKNRSSPAIPRQITPAIRTSEENNTLFSETTSSNNTTKTPPIIAPTPVLPASNAPLSTSSSWLRALFPNGVSQSPTLGGGTTDSSGSSNKLEVIAPETSNTTTGLTQDFANFNLNTLFEVLDYTGGVHVRETEFTKASTYGSKNGKWKKKPPKKKQKC